MKKNNKKSKKSILKKDIFLNKVSLAEKTLFAKHLSIMLKAGVTLSEAIEILRDQAGGKMKHVLSKVLSSIISGQSLANSLGRHPKTFEGLFINVVRAGESSGTLEESLVNISQQLKKREKLEKKVKAAMLYPSIVTFVAVAVGALMAYFVLPKITPLLKGLTAELPASTRFLIWFSDLVQDYGLFMFLGLGLLSMFFAWVNQQKFSKPYTHWVLLRLPILKQVMRGSDLARLCYSLNSLLKSGINIDEALKIAKETLNNYHYKHSLNSIIKRVKKGNQFTDGLLDFKELYPKILISMVRVGEKSGQLEEVLFYLSEFYEDEVDDAVKSLTAVIEPVLLIVIGLFVAFLSLAIMTPIYQITGGINL